jgi:hypothetical protein
MRVLLWKNASAADVESVVRSAAGPLALRVEARVCALPNAAELVGNVGVQRPTGALR